MTDKTNRLAQGQQETGGACLDGALEARKAQRQDREQHQAARVKALQALLEHLPFSDEGRRRLCDDLGTVNALMTEVAEELAADVGPDADIIGLFVGLKNAGWPPPFALMCALALRPMGDRQIRQVLGSVVCLPEQRAFEAAAERLRQLRG